MGWDCTFHLVDPTSIRRSIGLLVRGKPAPESFVAAYGAARAEQLWTEAARRVLDESPGDAATLACQIAIHLAASTLPHRAERGVALSFSTDPTPRSCGPWLPDRLTDPVDDLFKPLLKKRPELAGHFHRVFQHNMDTGVFIAPRHAEAAADIVRSALFSSDDEQAHRYWKLYRTLRAAARHGLAYWEATDLYPEQTRPEMIDPVSAAYQWLEPAPHPKDGSAVVTWAVEDAVFIHGGPDNVSLVRSATDLELPPRPCPTVFSTIATAPLPDGRWLTHGRGKLERYAIDAHGLPDERLATVETPAELSAGIFVSACGDAGAVLVPRGFGRRPPRDGTAWWYDGDATVARIEGLPAPERATVHGAFHYALAATPLGNGHAAILWNTHIYEIADGQILGEPWRLPLKVKQAVQSLCPAGNDGVYFGKDTVLARIDRGEPARAIAKLRDPIRRIGPGPTIDGEPTVLVVHRRHLKKGTHVNTAVLVFPGSGEEIAIHRCDTDLCDSVTFAGNAFWGRARRDPAVYARDHIFRLPLEAVLAIPRTRSKRPKKL